MVNELEQIEKESAQKNLRNFYQMTKQHRKGFQPQVNIIKDKDGRTLTGGDKIRERWAEYFKDLLNFEHQERAEERVYYTSEPEDIEPTQEEVRKAIKRLKNNKSPGSDAIPCEIIKKGGIKLEN